MHRTVGIHEIMDVLAAGPSEPGITLRDVGPVHWTHWDKPQW